MIYAGVDGCKKGWITLCVDEHLNWEIELFQHVEDIFSRYTQLVNVFIDVPIGLPFKDKRACDVHARKILGKKKASSVFPVPCREAVYATNYEEACEVNKGILGKRLSKQSWNICNKIKEVDEFLLKNTKYQSILKEAHPELNFYGWNDSQIMSHSKKSIQGITERSSLLSNKFLISPQIILYAKNKFKRSEVAIDDILDATILALSSKNYKETLAIPMHSENDLQGLEMKIWYYLGNKKTC